MKRLIVSLIFLLCYLPIGVFAFDDHPMLAYLYKGTWFVVNREGKVLFSNDSIVDVVSFKEGAIKVRIKDGDKVRWAFVNNRGKMLLKLDYDIVGDFSEGLCVVANYTDSAKTEGLYGYIDRNGKLIIPMIYSDAISFSEGLAYVMNKEKRGYIDRRGEMVIALENAVGYFFKGGIAPISDMRFKVGYINRQGELIIDFRFEDPAEFSEGLACVADERGFGYIDKEGNFVIKPQFSECMPFSEGLASVGKIYSNYEMKWGVIDKEGNLVVDFIYDYVSPFSEGMSAVKKGKKWMFIGPDGKLAFKKEFDIASSYKYGLAFVANISANVFGMIDRSGELKWKMPKPEKVVDLRFNKRIM